MKVIPILALLLLGLAHGADAFAQRIPLDDSLSPRQNYALDLQWSPQDVTTALQAMMNDDSAALPPLRGALPNVEIRLDTRRHVGQRVRIYLLLSGSLPGVSSAALELAWQGRGAFESGNLRPGQEALIFEGVVEGPVLSGILDVIVSLEGSGTQHSITFETSYELETLD